MQHISDISKRLSILNVRQLLGFSFMESSILTIHYIFGFCLFFKLYKFSLQILHLFSDHVIFLGSVDFEGYSVVTYFES